MTTETKRDLHADLAICNAATPGPWSTSSLTEGYVIAGEDKFTTVATVIEYNDDGSEYLRLGYHDYQDNRTFIAEAREGWPEAIRRALVAEAEVERLSRVLRHATCEECGDTVGDQWALVGGEILCGYCSDHEDDEITIEYTIPVDSRGGIKEVTEQFRGGLRSAVAHALTKYDRGAASFFGADGRWLKEINW